ncbi:MAG: DMT family transporter [Betaproteobacteria bacterium]
MSARRGALSLWHNDCNRAPEIPLSPPHSSVRAERQWLGPLYGLLGAFGFSAKAIFAKLAYAASSIDAITVLTFRMIFSLPFLVLMVWWAHRDAARLRFTRRDWIAIIWLGFVGYYLASLLDFKGLQYISASLERLILFMNPTLVVLLSALLLRKAISRRTALALALSYGGIVLVFVHDLEITSESATLLTGGSLVFGSAVAYAVYLIGSGEVIGRLGAVRFTAYGMLTSATFVFLHFLLTRPAAALVQSAYVYSLIAAMALFSTVLPIWCTNEAIRRIGSGRTAMIGTIGPVLTIGLGAMFLGEAVTIYQVSGAALVVCGVVLVMLNRRA